MRTVRVPRNLTVSPEEPGYQVARFPVLRDTAGYVRGYLPYLSFDVPLFFRILFGRGADFIIVEPPPTTGVCVRVAAALRRTSYAYYAADIWSDAAGQTSTPKWITRTVGMLEKWAISGAAAVFSVSDGVTTRLHDLGVKTRITTVGNGVDVAAFPLEGPKAETEGPLFVYAGTASEWHGACVFIDAFAKVVELWPKARLVFIGGGAEKDNLSQRAAGLGAEIEFLDTLPPEELAVWLRAASASLASVRPGAGYDFAFPTKLYGSAAIGVPLVFSGAGPAVQFVRTTVAGRPIGVACSYDPEEVAGAMLRLLAEPASNEQRANVSGWAHDEVSIDHVADRIREEIESHSSGG